MFDDFIGLFTNNGWRQQGLKRTTQRQTCRLGLLHNLHKFQRRYASSVGKPREPGILLYPSEYQMLD